MSQVSSHCCLCGLLCSLEHTATDHALTANCPRRQMWFERAREDTAGDDRSWGEQVEQIATLFAADPKPLIWIEAADVNTVRAAVGLTQASGATLHIAGSTGTEIIQRVITSEGWLGSSLAEVASHADLIVTLGDDILTESPLLRPRFFEPALTEGRGRWFHLSSRAASGCDVGATTTQHWPRSVWYPRLTELLWGMQSDDSSVSQSADLQALGEALLRARNCVWLWDVDEFCDEIDELTVRRLLGISRFLSSRARCSMLSIDSQAGRTTAHETLLWLTGCSATARFSNQHWNSPSHMSEFTLEDWAAAFDRILVVQSVPTARALPDLPGSHYLLPAVRMPLDTLEARQITRVAAAGMQRDGHLFRGDRATMFLCRGTDGNSPRGLPTAFEVLHAVHARVVAEELARVG